MLLFCEPPLASGEPDAEQASKQIEVAGLCLTMDVGPGRHAVSVGSTTSDRSRFGELVGSAEDERLVSSPPVSSVYLPPHHRWDGGPFSFRFSSSWRDSGPSVEVSLRHLRSLRAHPSAVVFEPVGEVHAIDAPVAALVAGPATKTSAASSPDGSAPVVEWRGWHVVPAENGVRVLTTNTEVWASSR